MSRLVLSRQIMPVIAIWALWVLRGTFALGMFFVLAFVEYGLPMYVPLWIYALITLFSYAVLIGLSSEQSKIEKFTIPALFTLLLGWFFHDSGDSPQAFMRQLHRVKPGMNIVQVEEIMSDYARYNRLFGITNTRRLPSGTTTVNNPRYAIYKHSTPDDGAYNAASGIVNFQNGRVTGVEYHGD